MKNIKRIFLMLSILSLSCTAMGQYVQQGNNGKFGLYKYDDNGDQVWLVKPKYKNIHDNGDGTYYICGSNGKWGLLSKEGVEIIPCKFNRLADVASAYNHTGRTASGDTSSADYTYSGGKQMVKMGDNGLYGIVVVGKDGKVDWLVKPSYKTIHPNENGTYYMCGKNNKWGLISDTGKEVVGCQFASLKDVEEQYSHTYDPALKNLYYDFTLTRDYTPYIREYVEKRVNEWQKKGEFEKTDDYLKRVNETTRNAYIAKLTAEVCEECLLKVMDKDLAMRLRDYDADHETYLVDTKIGSFVVPVPMKNAQDFKINWSKMRHEKTYDMVNGRIVISKVVFSLDNKLQARYDNQNQARYAQANVQFNFDDPAIPAQTTIHVPTAHVETNEIFVGKSDVDTGIPTTSSRNENTYALVFANENYREEVPVSYAHNDGIVFSQYLEHTLGLPKENIKLMKDATKNDILRGIDWLRMVSSANSGDVKFMVYYTGHGFPDEGLKDSYLVPVDGFSRNVKTMYSLKEFYKELGDIPSNLSLVFLDACFSGANRGPGMIANAKSLNLKTEDVVPTGDSLVVFSAAGAGETAWPLDEQKHGLFTYYLLKKLKDSKGNVQLGELVDYVRTEVSKKSVVVNQKTQTPQLIPGNMGGEWVDLKLK